MTRARLFALSMTFVVVVALGGAQGTAAQADQAMCTNDIPTMTAVGGVTRGTSGDDVILISNVRLVPSQAIVYGRGGNDVICGSRRGDKIYGGPGDDLIHGAGGNDTIWGGAGADIVYGERGRDRFVDRTEEDGWSQN